MGPLLMTGLACFGAAVAIGSIAAGSSPPAGPPDKVASYQLAARAMAIVLVAFVEGVAVIGVVVGMLAIEGGAVTKPSDGIFAAGPALIGALIGLGLILTNVSNVSVTTALICSLFIGTIGVLSVIVASLAWFIAEPAFTPPADWPFVILGLVSGGAALGIGVTGGRTVRGIPDADDQTRQRYQAAQVYRSMPFQVAAIGASAIAIVLVMVG